jgi:aspartokinase/homoserine dehydrogenase 1
MKVLKFGGTSLGSPERIRGVKKIIESYIAPCVVVVSAFQGVTDELKQAGEMASLKNVEYKTLLEKIRQKHRHFVEHLIVEYERNSTLERVDNIFSQLSETLNGIYLLRELSRHALDEVLSNGEFIPDNQHVH